MTHVQTVLDHADIPKSLGEMDARLSRLQDSLMRLKDSAGNAAMSHDFTALNDLSHYVALQQRDRLTLEQADSQPASDPLTMLKAAAQYRVMPKDEANRLRCEFMAKASGIADTDLTEGQIRKLHRLFLSYNPVGHMTPE